MNISSILVVFFLNWLIIFFISLPIGIKIPDKHVLGHANSAPLKTYLLLKTILSLIVSLLTTTFTIYFLKHYFF